MHILFDARWIRSTHLDGIGRYTLSLLQALAQRESATCYTLLFAKPAVRAWVLGQLPPAFLAQRAKVVTVTFDVLTLRELFHYPRLIQKIAPDIVYVPNYLTYPFTKKIPVVGMVNDLIPFMLPEVRTTWHSRLFYALRWPMRIVLGKMAWIVTLSGHTRSDVAAFFGLALQSMSVVGGGVGELFFVQADAASQKQIREHYGISGQYLLSVGRQEPYKNLIGLAQAYSKLPHALRQKYQLVLVGDRHRHFGEALASALEPLVRAGQVIFTGYVEDEHLPALYQMAELFVLPSLYEGFGLPVLEAMAAGTAVACSRATALPEVGGKAARYFDPKNLDEIAQVITDVLGKPEQLAAMGSAGQTRAGAFRWANVAEQMESVWQSIMDGASRGRS